MIVVITGTGRPFRRLVSAGVALAAAGRDVWIQHGTAELPPGIEGASIVPHSELLERIRKADAILCHGGSGAITDALEAGHVPVVMPRVEQFGEHINDHQLDIAQAMQSRNRAVLIQDEHEVVAAVERARALGKLLTPLKRSNTLAVAVQEEIRALARASGPGDILRARAVWRLSGLIGRLARLRASQ